MTERSTTRAMVSPARAQLVVLGGQDVLPGAAPPAAPGVPQRELGAAARDVLPEGYEAVTGDQFAEDSSNAIGQFLDVISTFLITFAVIAILVGGFIIAFAEVTITYPLQKVLGYLPPDSLEPGGLVQLLTTDYKFAVSFVILIVVLLIKPTGIMKGKAL